MCTHVLVTLKCVAGPSLLSAALLLSDYVSPFVHRPCAMVVPDFELICEIMLVAEGFQDARLLARKFITLYQLCKDLLSKQGHYDWGLRAIKSVLVVAGSLKRGDRKRPEEQVMHSQHYYYCVCY